MKKGAIALLLVLAVIILVSPGIVGKLAEQSVDENLNWAATKSGGLVVTSQSFDRGWFSSEGQHRIELGEGAIRSAITGSVGSEMPTLVITTRLDHGLIPFSSMAREGGSLAPGLGSAASTMVVEYGAGETFEVPGAIYSEIGLGGDLQSSYVLDAGSRTTNDKTATWDPVRINISTSLQNGSVEFDGNIGTLSFEDDQQTISIDGLTFSGKQTQTEYGFAVGTLEVSVGAVTTATGDLPPGGMKRLAITASSTVSDGLLQADTRLEVDGQPVPMFGDISVAARVVIADANAAAVGAVSQRLEALNGSQAPDQMMMAAEEDFKSVFAHGFEFRVDQFDVTLPMGTVETKMHFEIPPSDRASFEWTSLLLGIVASADISVPQGLVDLAMQMNPQAAGAVIGMGYLKQNGDVYEMQARYKKGVLTVNGAPIPVPLGMFQ